MGSEDYSKRVWIFREVPGKWIVAEGNDLMDIGDFNGDKKSEALFLGKYSPPANTYQLRVMDTFQPLSEVESVIGESVGPCYSIIGG